MPLALVDDSSDDNIDPITFDDFWALYPRRVSKIDARRAWDKIPPELHVTIITAIIAWVRVWEREREMQHIPYPASWLNGGCWDDELPRGFSAVRASTKLPDVAARSGPIPPHVVEVLRKIREKK